MKLAIIGATGFVGSSILKEALSREHRVTAISRHPEKITARPNVTARAGDVKDEAGIVEILRGHDAVISSIHFLDHDVHSLIRSVKKSGVGRLIIVGGAGSLEVAPGKQLVDTPEFPEVYKAEALAGRDFLEVLRKESQLDWTFISPSALFLPEARTGKFRIGSDQLLTDEQGESKISVQDYAIALLDEVEKPHHIGKRFTVGY